MLLELIQKWIASGNIDINGHSCIDIPIFIKYGDVKWYIIGLFKTLQSTSFLIVQISNLGIRCLCYITNIVDPNLSQGAYDNHRVGTIIEFFNGLLAENDAAFYSCSREIAILEEKERNGLLAPIDITRCAELMIEREVREGMLGIECEPKNFGI
jgi:hypothetical protein